MFYAHKEVDGIHNDTFTGHVHVSTHYIQIDAYVHIQKYLGEEVVALAFWGRTERFLSRNVESLFESMPCSSQRGHKES